MALSNALYSGLSGLSANSQSIAVTSDNISNSNTVGFRGSRTAFEDLLSRSIVGVGELGAGARVGRIEKLFSQGAIIGSGRASDMAISGRGFFVVNGRAGGVDGNFFTRAGNFDFDRDGFLVNPQGLRLQGYMAGPTGTLSSELSDLPIGQAQLEPNPTTRVDLGLNLDSRDDVAIQTFDITDPAGTSAFSNTIQVFDSLGTARNVTIYYSRTGPTSWDWNAVVDGGDLTGGTAGTPQVAASGSLTFTTDGELDTETVTTNTFNFANATQNQVIDFDFGDSLTTDGGDGSGSNAFATDFSIRRNDQDGYSSGNFAQMRVNNDGFIEATYSNGETRTVARVAMADFQSEQGLQRMGSSLFQATDASGEALIGFANTGGRGTLSGSSLEQSNVDISNEFVRLINDQRAFQAATRTITTADELLAETINLKR